MQTPERSRLLNPQDTAKCTRSWQDLDIRFSETIKAQSCVDHVRAHIASNFTDRSNAKSHVLQCVLMFADIQIFTALTILIGAFASLGCDIVAYHWQYMIYLAWLASVTHLASLSFLRNHLARNRVKYIWRLIAMTVIQVLLSAAVGLSTTFGGDPWLVGEGGRPAICCFKESPDTKSVTFQSAIKMIILLMWGLFIRIFKMFEGFEGGLRYIAFKLYQIPYEGGAVMDEWDSENIVGSFSIFHLKTLVISLRIVLSVQLDLFTSFLAEVHISLFLDAHLQSLANPVVAGLLVTLQYYMDNNQTKRASNIGSSRR